MGERPICLTCGKYVSYLNDNCSTCQRRQAIETAARAVVDACAEVERVRALPWLDGLGYMLLAAIRKQRCAVLALAQTLAKEIPE